MAKVPHTYHHIVPQCYLKNFAIKGKGGTDFVYVYDKIQNKSYKQAIRNIAGANDFYTVSDGFLDNLSDNKIIEKEYLSQMVEGKYSSRLKQTIDTVNRGERLSSELKDGLAVHIAIQFLRTEEVRKMDEDSTNEFLAKAIRLFKYGLSVELNNPEIAKLDVSFEYDRVVNHFSSSFGNKDVINEYAEQLSSNYWNLYYSQFPVYYTSSFPIVVFPHIENARPLCSGLTQYGAELSFPISPNIMLVIWDREYFKKKAQTDGNIVHATDEVICHFNTLRYLYAEQLYSPIDNFEACDKVFEKIGEHKFLKYQ